MHPYILTLRCPDQPGIVLAIAQAIATLGGNIEDSAQFSDETTGLFCVRTLFTAPNQDAGFVGQVLRTATASFGGDCAVRDANSPRRVLIMVSEHDHCLIDLLYRWERGELPVDIPAIVSNHPTLAVIAERHGVPFIHIPVTGATKADAERRLHELVIAEDIDFIVLARYMQILSDDFCAGMPGRIINIHHSFLPGFKGAKPYHQAHARGVKLIGATAHYVTADLDEGPIIDQDVARVAHAQAPDQLAAIGRDIESMVLARAVRLHAEDRVALVGNRTVIFG